MPILDMQAMKERFEASAKKTWPEFKPTYGPDKDHPHENKLKLFSWPPEGGHLGKRIFQHGSLGADGKKTAYCLKTFGANQNCPICAYIEAAAKSDDPVVLARAEKMGQRERYLMLVGNLDLLDKEKKKVVAIYNSAPQFYRRCIQEMSSENYDFTAWKSNPVKLICFRQGQNKPSSVTFGVAMREVELSAAEWMPLMPDLSLVIVPPSPKSLTLLLEGREMEEDDAPKGSDSSSHHGAPAEQEKPTQKAAPEPEPTKAEPQKEPEAKKEEAPQQTQKKPSLQDLLKAKKG